MILAPAPVAALARRMFRELDERRSIFDLPLRRAVLGHDHDLSVRVHGLSASTPFGPAAGPHTQLAQNIVLSWLAGGRIIELKTVQVRDDLDIPRPCIDMATVGFNIEWSQELRLEESLEEYVKALLLIRLLAASGRLPLAPGFDDTVLDLSVGYDLAGLRSPRVDAFLRGCADIRALVDRLRGDLPADLGPLRDVDVPDRLAHSVTLSTFHGCPPGEIADMASYLMREHGLHTVVKLNPTLLGPKHTRWLLNDVLGYQHLRVPDRAFEHDTTWAQMVDLVGRLRNEAGALGVGFGVKLTNTLIVENGGTFFPQTEADRYLSGPPLHVLAIDVLRRVRAAFGPDLPISFSAGVDAVNFPDTLALGLVPVTVCSDLLQPGGYGRAFGYFQHLHERMTAAQVRTLGDFVITAHGHAAAALDRLTLPPDARTRAQFALAGLAGSDGSTLRDAVGEAAYAEWRREAAILNTASYATAVVGNRRYTFEAHGKPPRKIGRRLHLFDCLTCDKCVPVCPNNAIFTFDLPRTEWVRVKLVSDGHAWQRQEDGILRVAEKHQIAIFADFCNACGNCDVFCPEDGGPYVLKPVFHGSEAGWRRAAPADGLFTAREGGRDRMLARFRGHEYRLDMDGHQARFSGETFSVSFDEDDPEHPADAPPGAGVEIDLVYFHIMLALMRAIRAPGAINYVNATTPA